MRSRLFMFAVLASMLLAPAVHAASDVERAKLLKPASAHSKAKVPKQEFNSGPEATVARLSCHTEAAAQEPNPSNRRKST